MSLAASIITILGLALFETVNSVDNAVINAHMLGTMGAKARRWFLFWGILTSVFLVRGIAPWLIVWLATPGIGPWQAFKASFGSDPNVAHALEASAPVLLIGAGVFLLMLFLHWLFMEEKHYGLPHEKYFHAHGFWFYAVAAILLSSLTWFAIRDGQFLAFSATIGFATFFVVQGFKENAEKKEREMIEGRVAMSDVSKLLYLEVIDACFSIDGVLGAFAFTLAVPLILIGNGLGALVVRQITVGNVERVKRLKLIKNGAMYSVGVLGAIMVAEAFGRDIPPWLSPVVTFFIIGFFFWKSMQIIKKERIL